MNDEGPLNPYVSAYKEWFKNKDDHSGPFTYVLYKKALEYWEKMNRYNVQLSIKACILGAMCEAQGDKDKAIKLTGLSRATFYRKLKKYNIKYERSK